MMNPSRYEIHALEIADATEDIVHSVGEPMSADSLEAMFKTVDQVKQFLTTKCRKRDDHMYFFISVNEYIEGHDKPVAWDDCVQGKGLNPMGRGHVEPEIWYWEDSYFEDQFFADQKAPA